MARPKSKKKTQAPPPGPELERGSVINLKGSTEYVEWLEALHRKTHISKAQIFRLAMAEWAEKHGHPSPPEI